MVLRSLQLLDIRNYAHAQVSFQKGIHAFIGLNAHGKTNLLESIVVCLTGSSFRTHSLPSLIREGAQHGWLEVHYSQASIEQSTRVLIESSQRSAWLNQTKLSGLHQLLGLCPCVVLQPQDLELVRGDPQGRRQFLDLQLAQSDPLYSHHLLRYRRALKQRNQLLKIREPSTCAVWEAEMARSGCYLIHQRAHLLQLLGEAGRELLQQLTGRDEDLRCVFHHCVPLEDPEPLLRAIWEKNRGRDVELGQTSAGPHREDFTLLLEGREARAYASEGQARSLATSLRLAEWQILRKRTGMEPILCVDDLGLSLDRDRCQRLWNILEEVQQVICTAPHLEAFQTASVSPAHVYQIESGSVSWQTPAECS